MTAKINLKKQKQIFFDVDDFYCGGGGSSTATIEAISEKNRLVGYEKYKIRLTAMNHWDVAITTHSRNHPDARHFCHDLDSLNPHDVHEKNKRLRLLIASPSCVHHSKARGGKPKDEQSRADVWVIARWIEKFYIENIIIENVPEFVDWGPLKADGTPDKRLKGTFFKNFIDYLKIFYNVEWRILNCADFGDATTRKRFFLIARRPKSKKIYFPEPTHACPKTLAKNQPDLFANNQLQPWRTAREIINWDLKGKNIYGRKKPLVDNTMKRIYAGLRKFSGIDVPEREIVTVKPLFEAVFKDDKGKITEHFKFPSPEWLEKLRLVKQKRSDIIYQNSPIKFDLNKVKIPFLVNMKASDRRMRSIDEPSFTQTANSQHQYLAQPILVNLSHTSNKDEMMCREIERPLPVICGKGMLGVVEPVLIKYHGNEKSGYPISNPLSTVTTKDRLGLCESFLVKFHGNHEGKKDGENRSYAMDEPLRTVDASNRFGIASAILVPTNHGTGDFRTHSLEKPMPTITGVDAMGFAEPFLVKFNNNEDAKDINNPLPTVLTKDKCGIGEPFLIQFYGERKGQTPRSKDIDSPLWTVTPQVRMGIVEPFLVKLTSETEELHGLLLWELGAILVVTFRMLHQSELAAAMSFPPDYYFHGTRDEQVRQIGNAVPGRTFKQLVLSTMEN